MFPRMAPAQYTVGFDTTKGSFAVSVDRSWSPNGADRFHELVESGFYDDVAFFRVLDGFVAQFGISGEPETAKRWREAPIKDDPVAHTNARGTLTFATAGPNTRTTQLFINLVDNGRLDSMGFSPFGRVSQGFDVVESLFSGYGEGAPRGKGPDQGRIQAEGNAYLKEQFPDLDYVITARITG